MAFLSGWGARRRRIVAALLALAAGLSCSPGGRSRDDPPNVLLIVVDTLRADHLGCYGESGSYAPTLDALAARGAQFRSCVSQAPWTLPAVGAILTGRYPSGHGANRLGRALPPSVPVLAEALRERGYETAAVVSHEFLKEKYGFARGFESFDESNALGHGHVSSENVTRLAIEWLESVRDPFFLFLHYFDPHYAYMEHEGFTRMGDYRGKLRPGLGIWQLRGVSETLTGEDLEFLHRLYGGEIRYFDRALRELLAFLRERGWEKSTVVVVTGDHGEEFREHGWIGHTRNLYRVLLEVPLILASPGRIDPGLRDETAMLVDIYPTILGLAGVEVAGTPGRNLLEPASGERSYYAEVTYEPADQPPSRKRYRKSVRAFQQVKRADKRSLQRGPWKVIQDRLTGGWELYDLEADPGERRNRAEERPDILEELRSFFPPPEAAPTEPAPEVDVSAEELERLRGLGYVD